MIIGFHTVVYSDDAAATRAFFRDVLGWSWVDAGDDWLIFSTPPGEMGVHPIQGPDGETWGTAGVHQVSIMCDDIKATVAKLEAKGVEFDGEVLDEGFGLTTRFKVPGVGAMMLYEARHPLAIDLD